MPCWSVEALVARDGAGEQQQHLSSARNLTYSQAHRLLLRYKAAGVACYLQCHCPRCKIARAGKAGYERALRAGATVVARG